MPEIDIPACISELLYEQQTVCLPGIGSITPRYKQAYIDHVPGHINPPAYELVFDPKLVLDDGLLAHAAAKKFGVQLNDAVQAVEKFIQNLQQALERCEMFTIKGIGRLYRDYEQKLQFLPDETNFNPHSYGLPTLKYYPIARRATAQTATATPAAGPTRQAAPRPTRNVQRYLLPVALLAVLAISLSIYLFRFAPLRKAPPADTSLLDVPGALHNVKPGQQPSDDTSTATLLEEDLEEEEKLAPALPSNERIGVIRVGRFGNPDNVKRLLRKATQLGLNPSTRKAGDLTEVIINFTYTDEQELKETLATVRKNLAKDAVLEK